MTKLGIRLWLRVGIEERMDGDEISQLGLGMGMSLQLERG